MPTGIIFALIALVGWGFGDFFIQRATRAMGSWKALFFIGAIGAVVLFPFVAHDVYAVWSSGYNKFLIIGASFLVLIAAMFDFEAMRAGKIAIIDPIIGAELPITVSLSAWLLHENLKPEQSTLVLVVFVGIVLAATTQWQHLHYHKRVLERGVLLAAVAAVGMAVTNVLMASFSRSFSPLLALWFLHTGFALLLLVYAWAEGSLHELWTAAKQHPKLILAESIFDNGAWLAYAYAVTHIPVAIAVAISESYIALAVLLGLFLNRERIRRHQLAGIVLAILGVIALAVMTE